MPRTPVKKNGNSLPSRFSKDELIERRNEVARLRMRGMGFRAIAKRLGIGHMTVKRDLEAIREDNRHLAANFDREDHVGETIKLYKEIEENAWRDYYELPAGNQHRQKFLSEIQNARRNCTRTLADLGVITKAPNESVIRVSTEVISHWSPQAQDLVAMAIIKSQLPPLAEPVKEPESNQSGVIDVPVEGTPLGSS